MRIVREAGWASALALVSVAMSIADEPREELKKVSPPTRAQLTKSAYNLKQIGLALHNYHDTFGTIPAAICDKNGKPLLSWRVAILPYIEMENLYKQFHLNEAWNSAHNKKLLAKMPKTYQAVRNKSADDETYYRVFVGNGAMFDLSTGTSFAKITDGLSNTIMVVEAGEAVPWTKPDELEYRPKKTLPALGGIFDGDFHVLLADGSVRFFHKGKRAASLHKLIVQNDGQVLTEDDLRP